MTKSRHILRPRHKWTPAEDKLMRARYPHERAEDVALVLGLTLTQVWYRANVLGVRKSDAFLASDKSGRIERGRMNPCMVATQYLKAHVPANKGLRRPGYAPGRMAETQFKKGDRHGASARNYVPLGTLRISSDGYLQRKITDDPGLCTASRWVAVHRLVWVSAHGPIPRGCVVAFRAGMATTNETEITVDKLECITRRQNMLRNSYHNYPQPIAHLIQLRGALNRKINYREKAYQKQN